MPPPARARRGEHPGLDHRGGGRLTEPADPPADRRTRAPRLDPATRRGLIIDAATVLLTEHDPLLVTFDQVAEAAGVSRALVHAYLGDRRGLIDAVQVQLVGRLDTWVGHGLRRASTPTGALRAVVHGTFAFVDADREVWGVLGTTGGLDHPALHGVRGRWAARLADAGEARTIGAQAVVGSVLAGVGTWVNRGVDPDHVIDALLPLVQMPNSAERTASTDDVGPS